MSIRADATRPEYLLSKDVVTETTSTRTVYTVNPDAGDLMVPMRETRFDHDNRQITDTVRDAAGKERSVEVTKDGWRRLTVWDPTGHTKETVATTERGATHTLHPDDSETWSKPGGSWYTKVTREGGDQVRLTTAGRDLGVGKEVRDADGRLVAVKVGGERFVLDSQGRVVAKQTETAPTPALPDQVRTFSSADGTASGTTVVLQHGSADDARIGSRPEVGTFAKLDGGFSFTYGPAGRRTTEFYDAAGVLVAKRTDAGALEIGAGPSEPHFTADDEFRIRATEAIRGRSAGRADDTNTLLVDTPGGQWRLEQTRDRITLRPTGDAWRDHHFEIGSGGSATLRGGAGEQALYTGKLTWDADAGTVTLTDAGRGSRVYGADKVQPAREILLDARDRRVYLVEGDQWQRIDPRTGQPARDAGTLLNEGTVARANGMVVLNDVSGRPFVRAEYTGDRMVYRHKQPGTDGRWTFREFRDDQHPVVRGTTRYHPNPRIYQDVDASGGTVRHYQVAKDGEMIRAVREPSGSWRSERVGKDGVLRAVGKREWGLGGGPDLVPWTWQRWVDTIDGKPTGRLTIAGRLEKYDVTDAGPQPTKTTWTRFDKDYASRADTADGRFRIDVERLHEQRIQPPPWDGAFGFGPRRPTGAPGWHAIRPDFREGRLSEDLYQFHGFAETTLRDNTPTAFGVRRIGQDGTAQEFAARTLTGRGPVRETRTTLNGDEFELGTLHGLRLSSKQIERARNAGAVPFTHGERTGLRVYDGDRTTDLIDGVKVAETDAKGYRTEWPEGADAAPGRWIQRDLQGRIVKVSDVFGGREVTGEKTGWRTARWSDGVTTGKRIFSDELVNPRTHDRSYFDLGTDGRGNTTLVQEYRALKQGDGIRAWHDAAAGQWRWTDGRHSGRRMWLHDNGQWRDSPPALTERTVTGLRFRDFIDEHVGWAPYRESVGGLVHQYERPTGPPAVAAAAPGAAEPPLEWTSYGFGDELVTMRLVAGDRYLLEHDRRFHQLRVARVSAGRPGPLLLERGIDGRISLTPAGRSEWTQGPPLPRAWDHRGTYTEAQAWLRETLDSDRRLLTHFDAVYGSTMMTTGFRTLYPKLLLTFGQELVLDFAASTLVAWAGDGKVDPEELIRAAISAGIGATSKTALTAVFDRAGRSFRGGIGNIDAGVPWYKTPYSGYAFDTHYAHVGEQGRFRAWGADFALGLLPGLAGGFLGGMLGYAAVAAYQGKPVDWDAAAGAGLFGLRTAASTGLVTSLARSVFHVSASGRLWLSNGPVDFIMPLPEKFVEKLAGAALGKAAYGDAPKP